MGAIKSLAVSTLEYFFPNLCPCCDKSVVDLDAVCTNCWSKLNFISAPFCKTCGRQLPYVVEEESSCLACIKDPPEYDVARFSFQFDRNSKKLIHYFKYYDKTRLASVFARILYNMYGKLIDEYDVLIPVPMHRFKRMLRFYNQSLVLAQQLSKISGKKVLPDVLNKVRWTKSQAMLSQKERKQNVNGSFDIDYPEKIQGKKVILIDDVSTTRSTVNACAKELRAYAAKVFVLCIAAT
ncbi:ComF family protein [Candidatus Phycorickettsia trachydisci]|nr:ComF family protein [Candidatus Phycorickettsia trachydisci]